MGIKYPIITIEWHITARCDQKCLHCYLHDDRYKTKINNELSLKACLQILDDIHNNLNKWNARCRIVFTGGDPVLREDFFEVLAHVQKLGRFSFGIMGNPYHVSEEVAFKLKQLDIGAYQISLDGLKDTHDFIRRPGSFDDSLRALRVLKKAGVWTSALFTLHRKNKSELLPLMKVVGEEGIDQFAFDILIPLGLAQDKKDWMLIASEFREIYLDYIKESKKLNASGIKTFYERKCSLLALILQEKGNFIPISKDRETIFCGCSLGLTLCILPDGTVTPCRGLPIPLGKVPEQSIRDIFIKSDVLNAIRERSNYKKCAQCDLYQYCRGCPAAAYAVHNDYFAPDPYCWKEVTKSSKDRMIQGSKSHTPLQEKREYNPLNGEEYAVLGRYALWQYREDIAHHPKVQEIIGRAILDEKFRQDLEKDALQTIRKLNIDLPEEGLYLIGSIDFDSLLSVVPK